MAEHHEGQILRLKNNHHVLARIRKIDGNQEEGMLYRLAILTNKNTGKCLKAERHVVVNGIYVRTYCEEWVDGSSPSADSP